MANEISAYRAAIGLFYNKMQNANCLCRSHHHMFSSTKSDPFSQIIWLNICCFTVTFLYICQSLMLNTNFVFIMLLIIQLSMDVHPNPGPTEQLSITIFHLNTRSIRTKLFYLSELVSDKI